MKVCIIGWYGTETIGDRAIFAGILALLSDVFPDLSVRLGSLHPFFSERTYSEDYSLWAGLCGREIPVELFDSSQMDSLKKNIGSSDLLLMGGGPLMDLREMHMVAYAFKYARRKKIKTGIFGCGMGPLQEKEYIKATREIIKNADFSVFRDSQSLAEAQTLCHDLMDGKGGAAVDPAARCAVLFQERYKVREMTPRIVINLRALTYDCKRVCSASWFEQFAVEMVKKVMGENDGYKVVLLPHHYFFFGGDDRTFMNIVKYRIGSRELLMQNHPLSLRETMEQFAGSTCCIGMRFHAMLLMILLNGRCRILNYTGSKKGKIRGCLNDLDQNGFFDCNRMVALDADRPDLTAFDNLVSDERFNPPMDLLNEAFQSYRNVLTGLL